MFLRLHGCTIDLDRMQIWQHGEGTSLTATEALLLRYLAERPGIAVSQEELLQEVWGYSARANSRTVPTTVLRLRKKLELDTAAPQNLRTMEGGYCLVLQAPAASAGPTFGRSGVVEALEAQLEAHGTVFLVGPAGVGKSHLARILGGRRESTFVDLGEARSPTDVIGAVANTLGIYQDTTERVKHALADRGGLLILDGYEGPDGEGVVAAWSGAQILVTSQVAPEGLASMELSPLSLEAARRMFRHLAQPYGRAIAPDALLQRLDCLPAALQAAAGWLDLLTPDALGAEVLAMDAGLQGALDRSWSRLSPDLQQMLAALAVFRGSFAAADAAAVAQIEPRQLRALQRRSWIQAEGGRLSLLACFRRYLEPRIGPTTQQRHLSWCASGRRSEEDCRAALRRDGDPGELGRVAVALSDALGARGGHRARVALAEHARTLPLSQEARIALSVGEASSHHLLGQPDEGLARLPTHLVDPRLDVSKAGLHAALGDLAAAITLLDPAIEQLRGTGLARALKVRAGVLRRLGRIDAGEADLRRARATLVGQHPALLAAILRTEGLFCFHRGRFDACIRLQTEAIEIDPQDGDTAWATQYIGRALMRLARLDEAAEVLEGSCEMLRRQGDRLGERVSLAGLAQLSYRRGDSDGALRWLRRSRQLGITSARDAPATALSFAMVHIDRWEGALALEFAQSARREFGALGEATSAAYAIEAAGLAHLVLGDRDQARKALDRAAEQLTACGLEAEATRPGAWLHFLDGTLPPEPTPSHLESDEVRCLEILRAATSGTPLPSEGLGALSRLARRLIEGPP